MALAAVAASFVATACSAIDEAAAFEDREPRGANPDRDGGGPGGESPGTPNATGIILVHAATFPSFRLCFSNFPDLVPLPDSKIMPEANVVGVDVGSLVRVDPLRAPGTVYVIDESELRLPPETKTPPRCGELVAQSGTKKTARTLLKDGAYHEAGFLDRPLGEASVSVLAITGCGGKALIDALDGDGERCGPSWNVTSGNLEAKVVDLVAPPTQPNDGTLPVQLFQLSTAIEALRGDAGTLEVAFGALAADGGAPFADDGGSLQPVAVGPAFTAGKATSLAFAPTSDAVYGATGFHVRVASPLGSFSTQLSLAAVQAASSSRDVPTTYYTTASTYALLLVGDPAHVPAAFDGGKASASYDSRRAVHLLAVPVVDPTQVDGGLAPGAGGDAGDGGGS